MCIAVTSAFQSQRDALLQLLYNAEENKLSLQLLLSNLNKAENECAKTVTDQQQQAARANDQLFDVLKEAEERADNLQTEVNQLLKDIGLIAFKLQRAKNTVNTVPARDEVPASVEDREQTRERSVAFTLTSNATASALNSKRSERIKDSLLFYNNKDKDEVSFDIWFRLVVNKFTDNTDYYNSNSQKQYYVQSCIID